MSQKRITMSEVARVARVHQTTVSLALRNDPRLPRETRERIRAVADSMGYRPDPMLAALNFYRSSRSSAKSQPSVAFLMRSRAERPPDTFYASDLFLKGARSACERMGYRLVCLEVGSGPGASARVGRILRSRGIGGVILGSLSNLEELTLEWDHFSALCIESQHLRLPLHTVGNDQASATRTAVRRVWELGYRSIGLAVGEIEEVSLGKPFTAGYLIESHEIPGLRAAPPLLLEAGNNPRCSALLGTWVRRHRISAVLSNWSNMPELLRAAGLKVPSDVGVATLDHNPRRGPSAGVRQSHEIVGERAAEALALLMKTNQRGFIRLPNVTKVEGVWQDAPDLPLRG